MFDAIRPYDVVARVGGEEFMVLLPGATLDAARAVGERLRSAISGDTFEVGIPPPIKITISIGVSEFRRDGDTLDSFSGVADQRLYRAKREGRNCVIAAQAVAGIGAPEMSVEFLRAGMSPLGTFETCRLYRAMSAFRGNPEDICSG